jgi:hypothetical protein
MTEFEKNCYGLTEADIREEYVESLTAKLCGIEMVVMGILSDAQHMVEVGMKEHARKYMNIAKFILSEEMEAKREKEAA